MFSSASFSYTNAGGLTSREFNFTRFVICSLPNTKSQKSHRKSQRNSQKVTEVENISQGVNVMIDCITYGGLRENKNVRYLESSK